MTFKVAISGLRAATANLDVTGNNIANSNTIGFKRSRAQFADVYAVSNLGSSVDKATGGVRVADIAQQFSQGNISFTDNSFDLAINGKGMYVLEDQAGSRSYSRAGAFGVDKDNYVVNATGHRLVGYGATSGVVDSVVQPIQLNTLDLPPNATTAVTMQVNLDADETVPVGAFDFTDEATYNHSTGVTVFDSLGGQHAAQTYFVKTGSNAWTSHMVVDGVQTATANNLTFSSSGVLTAPATAVSYGAFTPTNGAAAINFTLDLAGTRQDTGGFGLRALSQDGYSGGELSGVDVDSNGVILARFTNGQSIEEGQVVLANFANNQGLQPAGDTTWIESNASGAPLIGPPGSASLGLLQASALEEANVDLAEQLVNMIIAQRAFQANAQVIRTEDEVTQSIINIR